MYHKLALLHIYTVFLTSVLTRELVGLCRPLKASGNLQLFSFYRVYTAIQDLKSPDISHLLILERCISCHFTLDTRSCGHQWHWESSCCQGRLLLLLPLALQPAVGFGLSNNTSPFVPIYHQLSPSSHSQHLKISFCFFSSSFPGSSSSSRPFQFLSEDHFGHPILLHSLQVTQPTYPLPLYPFYYIFSFTQLF